VNGEGDGGSFGGPGAPGTPGTPDDDAGSGERVHALVRQGRYAEAHAVVDDAFVSRNGSAGYLLRSWILVQERRPADAREAVDWALAVAGPAEAADVFVLAGVVLLALDEAHAALTVALRASGADPDGWEPAVLLSDVYRRLGRLPEAVAAARRAVALAPREAEAQVALARSLTAGRGLLGRIPRRHRQEHRAVVERALVLGADPGELTAPRGGAVTGVVALVLFVGIQLFRVEGGDTWQLAAAGTAVVASAAVIGVLMVSAGRRTGVPLRQRLGGIRATVRTELAADPRLRRVREMNAVAVVPLVPLLTTALPSDRAGQGHPWPQWAVALAAATALPLLALAGLTVHWWYGGHFARRAFLQTWLGRAQLTGAVALPAATLALSASGAGGRAPWTALLLAHLGWLLLAAAVTLVRLTRAHAARLRHL
jgi:hypothetical protein